MGNGMTSRHTGVTPVELENVGITVRD